MEPGAAGTVVFVSTVRYLPFAYDREVHRPRPEPTSAGAPVMCCSSEVVTGPSALYQRAD